MHDPHQTKATKLMPQSPSSINLFETCPRQYAARYVLKTLPYFESPEQAEGNEFHRIAHMRLSLGATVPPKWAGFEPTFKVVDTWPELETEVQAAVGHDFSQADWGKRMVGGVIDVLSVNRPKRRARVGDWKTGKERDDMTQLEINAVTVFAREPEVDAIDVMFIYTKTGKVVSVEFSRQHKDKLERRLNSKIIRIKAAHETANFPPQPSGLCKKWCDVLTCEFNKKEL